MGLDYKLSNFLINKQLYNKLYIHGGGITNLQRLRSYVKLYNNFDILKHNLQVNRVRRRKLTHYRRVVRWSSKLMLSAFFKLNLRAVRHGFVDIMWFNKNQLLYSYYNNLTIGWEASEDDVRDTIDRFNSASFTLYTFELLHRGTYKGRTIYTNNMYNIGRYLRDITNITCNVGDVLNTTRLSYNYLTPVYSTLKHYSEFACDFLKLDSSIFETDGKLYIYQLVYDLIAIHRDYINCRNCGIVNTIETSTSSSEEVVLLDDVDLSTNQIWQIPQIRFNPGFMTFIRRARHEYALYNRINMHSQGRLTRYLYRFRRLNNMSILNLKLFTLDRFLVRTRFSLTIAQAQFLITGGFIFVNNCCVYTNQFKLQVGDYVQVRYNYNILSFVLFNLKQRLEMIEVYGLRMDQLLGGDRFNSVLEESGDQVLLRKHFKFTQLVKLYNIIFDIPKYVELDYLTLSFIILHECLSFDDYDFITIKQATTLYFKALNWKYIT